MGEAAISYAQGIRVALRSVAGARVLLRDRRGATMVEFAFVITPFIALIFAVLVTSLAYFVQETLETGVERAARNVVTGRAQAADDAGSKSGMTQQQLAERFRKAGCATLPSFLPCSRLYVEVKSASDWTTLDNAPPAVTIDASGRITNTFRYDMGSQGSIVLVRFMYLWPVQASPMFNFSNVGNDRRLLMSTSVAKSETYS